MSQLLKKLILFNLVIRLFSCNVETHNNDSTHEISVSDTLEIFPNNPTERVFDFSEMPSKWWLLTKEGDNFIRYNQWDAQDEIIEFVIGNFTMEKIKTNKKESYINNYDSTIVLSSLLEDADFMLDLQCGGIGVCGKCTVIWRKGLLLLVEKLLRYHPLEKYYLVKHML